MKKIILLFLIIGCFFSFSAIAEGFEEDRLMATGICGGYMDESYGNYTNSVTWKLYESGRCVIEGDGSLYNRDEVYNFYCFVCESSWSHHSFWCGHYDSEYESDEYINTYEVVDFSSKIKTIEFTGDIYSIGYGAFNWLDSLEEITLPSNIEVIEMMTFCGCSSLEEISIPENVTVIEYAAFEGCSSLLEITIPDDVTVIAESAFSGCEALKTINIPESVTTLEDNAFSGCTALEKIAIPKNVSSISASAFSGCNSLEIEISEENPYFTVENGLILNKAKTEIVYVPASISGVFEIPDGITAISDNLFLENEKITEVILPDTVTKIGRWAFSGCTSLSKINLPDSITEILSYAFSGCTSLKEIKIPKNVTGLSSTFYGCTSLENVTLPDGIKTLDSAFENCDLLSEIILPDSLVYMDSAFDECISLKKIIIPKSVTSFYNAFYGCKSLEDVVISEGITEIGGSAFYGCSSLNTLEIPNSIIKIGYAAFCNCTSLDNIEIPSSVTEIYDYAFAGCTSLKKVSLPEEIITLEPYVFYDCIALEEVVLPQKLENIKDCAFTNCKALTKIEFPDTLEEISYLAFENVPLFNPQNITEDYYISGWLVKLFDDGREEYKVSCDEKIFPGAFSESGITRVYFDDEITEIKPYILFNNTSLKYVEIPASVTKIGQNAFSGCTALENVEFSPRYEFSDLTGEMEEIQSKLQEIGWGAFSGCSMLYDIKFPKSLKKIDGYAFYNCSGLKNLYISENMRYIGDCAFKDCTRLETVIIIPQLQYSYYEDDENSTGVYADYAFGYYGEKTYVDTLYIGSDYYDSYNLEQTGLQASKIYYLYGCDYDIEEKILEGTEYDVKRCQANGEAFLRNVYTIKIKEGTTSIGGYHSYYDPFVNLRHFILPESLEYIGEYGLLGLYNISVTIPKNVSYISPLCGWNEYTYIDITSGNEYYSSTGKEVYSKDGTVLYKAYYKDGTYIVPQTVSHIFDFALDNCYEIIMHKNVKKIGEYALGYGAEIYYEGTREEWDNIEILIEPYRVYNVHFNYGKKMPKSTCERAYSSESKKWYYSLNVSFPDIELKEGTMVFACGIKDNGSVTFSQKELSCEDSSAELILSGDIENIKVFAWENLATMKPLASPEEIYIHQN